MRAWTVAYLLLVASCAPRKPANRPTVDESAPLLPDSEAIAMEESILAEKRAERQKLGERVSGDRARLYRTLGFPDANATGKSDVDSVQAAEWWMYGKRFRKLPDGTGQFECSEIYYFDGDKLREMRVNGSCK